MLCLFFFLISFPAWRSQGTVWINQSDHAKAERKIESVRCFIRNWNWSVSLVFNFFWNEKTSARMLIVSFSTFQKALFYVLLCF